MGRWTRIHWGLLLVALVILVVAGQGQHFFYDEWAFVGGKLDAVPFPDRYLLPHNEHLTLLPLLAFRTLRATVGVGSYWPYLGLLLLLHLGVTHLLWRLMLLSHGKPIVATALAAVFSVFGAAAEDLVWAFQITFVGSTLLGLSAVWLAVTGSTSWLKTGLVSFLIIASLATSGVGLAYLIVVPTIYAQRRWRRAVIVLGSPLLLYLTWYEMYGHSLMHPPVGLATAPLTVCRFIVLGLAAALTGLAGFAVENWVSLLLVGIPALGALALACRGWWTTKTLAGRTPVAMCLGALGFFGTVGLARGGLGAGFAFSSRYSYVASALMLPAIALAISRGTDRHPRLAMTIVPVSIAIAASNVLQLMTYAGTSRSSNEASTRVLAAGRELIRSDSPVFADQLPEPLLAPDLTTSDLRSGHLDAAFDSAKPGTSDRLTSSLNLQIRVAPAPKAATVSPCRTINEPRVTVPAGRRSAPTFAVTAAGPVGFRLYDAGSRSAERELVFARGTYLISSLRGAGHLEIEPKVPSQVANC